MEGTSNPPAGISPAAILLPNKKYCSGSIQEKESRSRISESRESEKIAARRAIASHSHGRAPLST